MCSDLASCARKVSLHRLKVKVIGSVHPDVLNLSLKGGNLYRTSLQSPDEARDSVSGKDRVCADHDCYWIVVYRRGLVLHLIHHATRDMQILTNRGDILRAAKSGSSSWCLSAVGYLFHGDIFVSIGIRFQLVDIEYQYVTLYLPRS